MKRHIIDCPKCDGSGRVGLDPVFVQTLNVLKSLKSATASEVYQNSPDKEFTVHTVANVRLEFLRNLGLVERTKRGKFWVYSVVKNQTTNKNK